MYDSDIQTENRSFLTEVRYAGVRHAEIRRTTEPSEKVRPFLSISESVVPNSKDMFSFRLMNVFKFELDSSLDFVWHLNERKLELMSFYFACCCPVHF